MEKDSKNYDVISISFLNIILRYLTFFLKQKIHTVIYIYIFEKLLLPLNSNASTRELETKNQEFQFQIVSSIHMPLTHVQIILYYV